VLCLAVPCFPASSEAGKQGTARHKVVFTKYIFKLNFFIKAAAENQMFKFI